MAVSPLEAEILLQLVPTITKIRYTARTCFHCVDLREGEIVPDSPHIGIRFVHLHRNGEVETTPGVIA